MLEINGVKYQQKEIDNASGITKKLHPILVFSERYFHLESKTQKILPKNVDIVKEFELIQLKKSKLSKSNRDLVESIFHKHFEIVKPNNL